MERVVFFQLVDALGQDMADMDRVPLSREANVMDLREAVKGVDGDSLLHGIGRSQLQVFANRAAFVEKKRMGAADSIETVGVSCKDPVIVQVPPRQPTVAASATAVMPAQAPKLCWKPEFDLSSSLKDQALHFVNRDVAVAQLCSVHENVFIGAGRGGRGFPWQIALADNELGLGKTVFGLNYIQRCRDMWRLKPRMSGFQESLCACRTLRVVVKSEAFATAVSTRGLAQSQDQAPVLEATITTFLVNAIVDQLDLPAGAPLPTWLASPTTIPHETFLRTLVREMGHVFIVLDEIGQGFTFDNQSAGAEERSRDLFLNFCRLVLTTWMNTKGLYFMLMGFAPYLRNVGERTDSRPHPSSGFDFIRLNLHLIRPPHIEEILRKTWMDSSQTETLADSWNLKSKAAIEEAAHAVYTKTCGHPRTMQMMFHSSKTYADFHKADDRMSNKDWGALCRELRTYRKLLGETFLDAILKGETIDLREKWDCPHPSGQSINERSVSFFTIAERCCLGWEGNVHAAKLYALPHILTAMILITQPLRKYLRAVSSNADRVTLAKATVFEWACLKRFQELFHDRCSPQHVFPEFFGADTAFGKLDGVQLPETVLDCPKITKQAGSTTSLDARTAHPEMWKQLMDEIVPKLEVSSTRSLCIKPLPESSSSDVIFRHHDKPTVTGSKRTHGAISPTTLTMGIAVKNYSTAEFSPSALGQERQKFAAMFSKMDDSTKERFGKMINVLVVCSTKYSEQFAKELEGKCYVKKQQEGKCSVKKTRGKKEEDPIAETILLNLTTPELRAQFFGLGDDPGLAIVLEGLLNKAEPERATDQDEAGES